jgi:hypothetical protein
VGFSPLDQRLGLVHHSWTPGTIGGALRLAVDVPSYHRAAEHYQELTHVSLSKSSLQLLMLEYGGELVEEQAQEAEELASPMLGQSDGHPPETPAAAGETMAVSLDGVMVNIRGEGWKEVKVASVSAVELEEGTPEPEVRLTQHSYRAGLWDAETFGRQQWAEAWRRGIQSAKRIVAVCDAAAWIWVLIATCYAPCVEIIDWWHAVKRVWEIVHSIFDQGAADAGQWGAGLKEHLWAGQLRALLHEVREHWPRGEPLPESLRQAVGYLFRQRKRMRYQDFREAGCPIGSGTVESACKVVVQERMTQAGMRWGRPGAQALLALRCALLSNRWAATWRSLAPPQVT